MTHRKLAALVVVGALVVSCGGTEDADTADGTTVTSDEPTTTIERDSTTSAGGSSTTTEEVETTVTTRPSPRYGTTQPSDETTSTSAAGATSTSTAESTTTTAPSSTTTSTEGDEPDDSVRIEIEGFSFNGPTEIPAGTKVTVVNRDSVPHTWTATDGAFDSGRLAAGDSFTITLSEPGEFAFFCQIHPSMTGSITVTG